SIQWQFHQLLRMVPRNGCVISNGGDANVEHTLKMGCWTPIERFSSEAGEDIEWHAKLPRRDADGSRFEVIYRGKSVGTVDWSLLGRHNVENAIAAIAAARHAGVAARAAIDALNAFKGVRRRMEVRGVVNGITVYDDFAHHPTAVATTVEGLRRKVGKARIIAVLEPRSNTMKLGTHSAALAQALSAADRVWMYQGPEVKWDVSSSVMSLGARASVATSLETLIDSIRLEARSGDHVLIMSNGGFGGVHGKLLDAFRAPNAH
ncbi:MAG TPA: cyanophycin synthetase, partial [Steroidobacteraceae bacterium]|nr:cyanophycin synthetase [Steroidobacteraceae bacterium]